MSITVRMKPKTYITAYHCMACGAPCEKDTLYCRYCKTRYEADAIDSFEIAHSKIRLLADCGNDYVYFPVHEVGAYTPKTFEVGRTEDNFLRRIPGLRDPGDTFDLTVYATPNIIRKQLAMKNKGIVKMRIEIAGVSSSFNMEGYFSEMSLLYGSPNEEMRSDLKIIPTKDVGWLRMKDPPVDIRCPNCGAPINSRYGCCDYCTGWVEYVNGI